MKTQMQPKAFLVRQVDPSHAKNGRVWGVKQGERWRFAEKLCVQVTVATVDVAGEGACLSGVGVVRCLERGEIVITA